jgi:Xaa-Pro dipeptidase
MMKDFKTQNKIKNIKKACKITDKIIKLIIKNLKKQKFKTEIEINNFIKQQAKVHKTVLAFPPVIATGKNAAEIHHIPNKTKIKKGFLVMDLGVKYKGFCSDCTRTVYIGDPSKKEKKLYNLILQAQLTSLNHAIPKTSAADIDLIARGILIDHYKNFVHGLGHGVSKKIHSPPTLAPKSKSTLKKNQIITIEPGLYFKNKLGIRIEDTIIVKNKPIILTKTTKKLIVIKNT